MTSSSEEWMFGFDCRERKKEAGKYERQRYIRWFHPEEAESRFVSGYAFTGC